MDKKITDLALVLNKLVSTSHCDYFINLFEKFSHLSINEESYKYDTKKREGDNFKCLNLDNHLNLNNEIRNARNLAWQYIKVAIENYVDYIKEDICPTFSDLNICNTHNIRILKYEKGHLIKDHTDVNSFSNNYSNRASCTLNLNDNYKGGNFRFFSGRDIVTLKKGDGLIFPTEPIWIHGTEPIETGTRYSINCFLHD